MGSPSPSRPAASIENKSTLQITWCTNSVLTRALAWNSASSSTSSMEPPWLVWGCVLLMYNLSFLYVSCCLLALKPLLLAILLYYRLLDTSLITMISTGAGFCPSFSFVNLPVICTEHSHLLNLPRLFSASVLFMEGWRMTKSSLIRCLRTFCSAYPYAKLYVQKEYFQVPFSVVETN